MSIGYQNTKLILFLLCLPHICGGLLLCESRCSMSIEMSLLFGAIGTLLGVLGAIITMKKDSKNQGASEASIFSKVDYIARGVDDIKLDLKDQARKIESQNERLIRVEESAKSAHKRLDKVEGNSNED